ncbi:MAG: CGNR zinc finger domain-containing protein [Steroidobacteraceae bacterium]
MSESQPRPRFDLCGGHPVLDFVNSLDNRFRDDGPTELLTDYATLLGFTRDTGLLDERHTHRLADCVSPAAAARALHSARDLREALAAAFYAHATGRTPPPAALATLERHFHAANRHRELRWGSSPGKPARGAGPRWDRNRFSMRAELPAWLLSQAAAQLMLSDTLPRVRACAADNCRWLFLDTSRNHTRRWCNMRVCGNRMKARRFQARR